MKPFPQSNILKPAFQHQLEQLFISGVVLHQYLCQSTAEVIFNDYRLTEQTIGQKGGRASCQLVLATTTAHNLTNSSTSALSTNVCGNAIIEPIILGQRPPILYCTNISASYSVLKDGHFGAVSLFVRKNNFTVCPAPFLILRYLMTSVNITQIIIRDKQPG